MRKLSTETIYWEYLQIKSCLKWSQRINLYGSRTMPNIDIYARYNLTQIWNDRHVWQSHHAKYRHLWQSHHAKYRHVCQIYTWHRHEMIDIMSDIIIRALVWRSSESVERVVSIWTKHPEIIHLAQWPRSSMPYMFKPFTSVLAF